MDDMKGEGISGIGVYGCDGLSRPGTAIKKAHTGMMNALGGITMDLLQRVR